MKVLNKEEVKKDINENRNYSWIKEIYARHKNELNRVVIDYFGKKITYKTFFDESIKLAKALKVNGIKKGDEFVVCLDRIPELVYFLGAASIVGAKINIVSEKFDENYLSEIICKADSKTLFIQSNKLDKFSSIITKFPEYKIVTVSHKRSLPEKNEYDELLEKFYNTNEMTGTNDYVDYDEFLTSGLQYKGELFENTNLEDAFTVTYSSGTTKKGLPKAIVHKNRHYIMMGRYHDPEVSGVPSLTKYNTYSNIPAYSNTYILSSISDNMILGGKIMLDPIDDPEYFLIGAKIHKGNMNVATTTTWITGALDYYDGDKYGIKTLPDALFNFVGGEQLTAGEEKFLNRFFKDAKCGINLTHTPFSIAKASTAGADCEHGSIFVKIFRAYFNNAPYRIGRSEPVGMAPYDFVDVKVLRDDGTYCDPMEHGRLVVNSDCTMLEYNHDPEETRNFYITDAYGKVWGDMKNWGFIDEHGNVSMKGRYLDNNSLPCYRIADEILKDTKKIMSCEVVCLRQETGFVYVAHIMPQYGTSFNTEKVLDSAMKRCINKFGHDIENILYFRIHDFNERYPIADSSKRDIQALIDEGLDKVVDYKYKSDKSKKRIKKY